VVPRVLPGRGFTALRWPRPAVAPEWITDGEHQSGR